MYISISRSSNIGDGSSTMFSNAMCVSLRTLFDICGVKGEYDGGGIDKFERSVGLVTSSLSERFIIKLRC